MTEAFDTVVRDDHPELTRSWRAALRAAGQELSPEPPLAALLERAERDLSAIPFDPAAGTGLGSQLAEAGLRHATVPVVSAPVVCALAEQLGVIGHAQVAAYTSALGQGHQRAVTDIAAAAAPRVPDAGDIRAARLQLLFDKSAAAIALGDTEGRILEANQSLADMIGVPVETLTGISVYDFAHPDDHARIRQLLYEELIPAGRGTVSLRQRLLRADGTIGWMNVGITYAKGSTADDPDYLIAIGADVTDQYQHQLELHRQGRHDPLTGLPNRRHLIETIDRCSGTAAADDLAGLCLLDLDRFKQINDRWGHHVGDLVLTAVADRLRADRHEHGDSMIARIGGDEFVALIAPPTTPETVAAISRRLAEVFAEPVTVDGLTLRITASIGAITTPIAGTDAETLLATADAGLYSAKSNRAPAETTVHTHSATHPRPAPPPDREAPQDTTAEQPPFGTSLSIDGQQPDPERSSFVAGTSHSVARESTPDIDVSADGIAEPTA
ncbi:diguanylate cyclase domain-containing protein [Nocardia sp. NPDC057227]|uniref:diguanylate cyclase domain-containing protein n=1 Tax=Nocardia sp. NPDC057227 TaxID=3346056 RepID=UPI003634E790